MKIAPEISGLRRHDGEVHVAIRFQAIDAFAARYHLQLKPS